LKQTVDPSSSFHHSGHFMATFWQLGFLNDDDTENRKPQTENGKLIFLPNFAPKHLLCSENAIIT
jgi:hypothetical protein